MKDTAPGWGQGGLLQLVIEVAREAGDLIRAELERPGGPRGPLGKCPVDDTAEVLIRDRLRAEYPDWQFFGEETGTTGEASEFHWLVDPHDGTSAFQRGHRGSAVSIALLRGEQLVLGVVHAPCPPVGEGDLIAWAEGLPVTRNGEVVDRAWPAELGRYDVVLVSQDADQKPTANAELVAPARFLGVPSVAYRLALTAVGEGEAAVSVAGTADYDFAAAHAIVKAVGGLVVDAHGNEPRYAASGGAVVHSGGLLVGGAPEVVRALVQRPWSKVRAGRREDVPFVRPTGDRVQKAGPRLDRAQGILLGQLIGDALGAQVEFENAGQIAARFPDGVRALRDGGPFNTQAGQPTDDSEMALALARSLVRAGRVDLRDVAEAYVHWFRSDPFDMGNTVRRACAAGSRALAQGRDLAEAMRAAATPGSQANGALMRVSPLAIFTHRDVEGAVRSAIEDARLTHPSPVCLAANAAFVAALVDGLNGGHPASMTHAAALAAQGLDGAEAVLERLELAPREAPVLDAENIGWALHALQNAFFELLNAPSFEEGLVRTVGRGGDTDTNGAITGALLGAAHGAARVPLRWRRAVLSCRASAGTRRPRPTAYWPVDALQLAEALL